MNFKRIDEIKELIRNQEKTYLLVGHRKVAAYPGMVIHIVLRFDETNNHYDLDLDWICFGLDLFGDNLVESYVYRFDSLENLLLYLEENYAIKIEDIPLNYKFNSSEFPDPIHNQEEKAVFQEAWDRFQHDFKAGLLLDKSQNLVYSSYNNKK